MVMIQPTLYYDDVPQQYFNWGVSKYNEEFAAFKMRSIIYLILIFETQTLSHRKIQYSYENKPNNKKVFLRERKRHTACCVVTTPSVVLTGYPPVLTWLGGYLT